jgi:hypothetical protein
MPSAPAFDERAAAPAPVARPKSVDNAFMAWILVTAVGLVGLIVNLTVGSDDLRKNLQETNRNYTPKELDDAVTVATVIAIVVSLLFIGLYLLFVYKMRAGRNWARITLTVLGGLSVVFTLIGAGQSGALVLIVGLIQAVLIVAAVYLMYRPDANQYFAAGKRVR